MELSETLISSSSAFLSSLAGILDVSLNIFILGGVFIAVFLYAFFGSKKAMIASLFALIFTGFLFLMFPYWGLLETESEVSGGVKDISIKTGALVGFFFVIRFAIRHSVRGNYCIERSRKFAEMLGLSFAASGLILIYGYRFISLSEFFPLSPEITDFLTSPQAFFWWLVGALAVVYFFSD